MIQRIQTVYLLLAVIAESLLTIFPFANSNKAIAASSLFEDAAYTIFDNPAMLALFGVAAALFLVAVFLFKNRKLQLQISTMAMIVILIGIGFTGFLLGQDQKNIVDAVVNPQVGIALPLIGLILALLANRAIRKDDKLVKASNRLR